MKLHLDTGEIQFEKGKVGGRIRKSEFLASALGSDSEVFVSNGSLCTYRFHPEPGIAATVSFDGDRLTDVTLMLPLSADDELVWSEELERKRKTIHDNLLRAEFGAPPYRYAWGEIASVFDQKSCVSDIIVRYSA